jgi:uncharacterized membrane protein
MKSQEKWGLGLLLLGAVIIAIFAALKAPLFVGVVYGIPLIAMGLALIIYRNRENKIEK